MLSSRLNHSFELACPKAVPLGRSEAGALSELMSGLKQMDSKATPFDAAGLELRVALFVINREAAATGGDNSFWLRKCRSLFLRPAVEPLILATWTKLKRFEMTDAHMSAFCSLLCASRQQARTRDSYGLWDGADVRFDSPDQARSWWQDIQAAASRDELASLLPAYAFARTIIAHPFPDGNGRLARALVHASLARIGDISAPVLPLAPAFYMNGSKIAAALRQLSESGDWGPFVAAFHAVLGDASTLLRRVQPGHAGR